MFSVSLFVRKNAFMIKVLFSYIIVGTLLLCGLSILMYNSYSRAIHKEIETNSEKVLAQSQSVVETYWNSTLEYLLQFHVLPNISSNLNDMSLNSGSVFKALYGDTFEALEMGDISKKLSEIASSNPIIHSIYVYNKRSNLVFSNLSVASSIDDFYDRDAIQSIETTRYEKDMNVMPRKVSYQLGSNREEYQAITIQFVEDEENGKPASVLVFNLKQSALQQMVNRQAGDGSMQFFILDREGNVISHPRDDLLNKNISDQNYIREILASGGNSGHFTTEIDQRKMLINYEKSDHVFKWIFVGVGDYQKLLWNFTKINETVLLLAGIFILISLTIGILFAKQMYKPVRQLIRKIRSNGNDDNRSGETYNEYEYIDRTIERLVSNVVELEQSVREGMPALRHDFLRQLVLGTVAGGEATTEQAAKLKLRLDGPSYRVCIFRLCAFAEWTAKLSERDMSLLRYALANIAEETLSVSFAAEAVIGGADHVAVVVNVDQWSNSSESELLRLLSATQDNIETYVKLTVTAAIGGQVDKLDELHSSYLQALQATVHRLVYGKSSIIRYEELVQFPKVPYQYPFELEKKINDALRSGERDKAIEGFESFLDEVCQFSNDEIMLSLTQLAISHFEVLPEPSDRSVFPADGSYKTIIRELSACDDFDDIRQRFDMLYSQVISGIRERKELKNKDVVDMVVRYTSDNFRNPNLTVENIAEVVGLSSNYVRTIFKSHTDQSLSAFISELRFQEAKKLLLETNEHANKIAGHVGFSSGKYFYASFKKQTGHTPDEFRRTFRTGS
ncbi:helix-turn-helix domain-containing protein [Cohnella silvisoli]|uniref:Helix-turn-helix domain-containing protein n=1 Tax=Cohnella silvisoli TaxID=2873699 RepID=A0ABV1KNH9_9BACL|nr:helix-turn-helix domain-containing protein [Cohnella silvisoli]MCD9021110.1 helix-turn-helix domain-containing protein [Cohnella silvisoli]